MRGHGLYQQGGTSRIKRSGPPEIIHGMKYGGTRYKYDLGVWIDHVEATGEFIVHQAGSPKNLRLGMARSLAGAERLAEERAKD